MDKKNLAFDKMNFILLGNRNIDRFPFYHLCGDSQT